MDAGNLRQSATGGPISDYRIVSANRQSVTFLAREGKQVGGCRTQVPITISTQEFTQRWSEHIQPDHLTKVRYFGGWSNSQVGQYMRRCHDLSSATTRATAAEPDSQDADRQPPDLVCESCGSGRMVLQSESSPPSWRELLGYGSSASPAWYAALRDESDRIFWDGLMGEGFNAWYLETLIESAKEAEVQPPPPIQLHLPGFAPPDPSLLNSF